MVRTCLCARPPVPLTDDCASTRLTYVNAPAHAHSNRRQAKFDKVGQLSWAYSWGGTDDDLASDISLDFMGNFTYVVGHFKSPQLVFNGNPGPPLANGAAQSANDDDDDGDDDDDDKAPAKTNLALNTAPLPYYIFLVKMDARTGKNVWAVDVGDGKGACVACFPSIPRSLALCVCVCVCGRREPTRLMDRAPDATDCSHLSWHACTGYAVGVAASYVYLMGTYECFDVVTGGAGNDDDDDDESVKAAPVQQTFTTNPAGAPPTPHTDVFVAWYVALAQRAGKTDCGPRSSRRLGTALAIHGRDLAS